MPSYKGKINFSYLYDKRHVFNLELGDLLKLGFYTPRKLEIGVLFSLMITFQSDGSKSHFKEKFLDCKRGKRLILPFKRFAYISKGRERPYNDTFFKVSALFLFFALGRIKYFSNFYSFYSYTKSISIT